MKAVLFRAYVRLLHWLPTEGAARPAAGEYRHDVGAEAGGLPLREKCREERFHVFAHLNLAVLFDEL